MNESIEYIPYENIVDYLDISKGDIIYFGSQILSIAFNCKKHGETFDPNLFINSIQRKLGEEGTLIIPTFNWDFSNYGYYDYRTTVCTTGSMGTCALNRKDFKKTKHPMQSFAVWGKDKNILVNLDNIDSYDENSPFEYMFKNHAKCLIAGTDYKHAFTFIHYVEKKVTVPYRFTKLFEGRYIDEFGNESVRKYSSYVRHLDMNTEEKFNIIGEILENKGISNNKKINTQNFIMIDLYSSFFVIEDDIINNGCRGIYSYIHIKR